MQTVPAASAASTPPVNDSIVTNPSLPNGLMPAGQGRIAEDGSRSYLLYAARYTGAPWVMVRDTASTGVSHVALPTTLGATGWAGAVHAVSGDNLWVLSGAGPVYLQHYRLSGSPPNQASLLAVQTLGDSDSRTGAIGALAGGKFVGVWHQQGATGPQGLTVVDIGADGAVRTVGPLSLPSMSSRQAVAQHPGDGSVWVFSSADANGAIGAVHLTDTPTGLRLDWIDGRFIDGTRYGGNGPDPEMPDLEAAPDPATGTIAVAYQNAQRRVFSTSPWVVGSFVSVARIASAATVSFLTLPAYVERISGLGLVVRGGETWLAYRAVNADLTFDRLELRRSIGGVWDDPVALSRLDDPRAMVYAAAGRLEVAGPMADNQLHLFTDGPPPSGPTTTTSTTTSSTTSTTTAKRKGGGKR